MPSIDTERLPYGLGPCPRCDGTGHKHVSVDIPVVSPCPYCRGVRHIVSWWADAFLDRLTFDGPMLVSGVESLSDHCDPAKVKWVAATLSWERIVALSQGPCTNRIFCQVGGDHGSHRSCSWAGEIPTTYCYLTEGMPRLIGLPFTILQSHWRTYLKDQEKRRHEK